jgi:hypothetical protein
MQYANVGYSVTIETLICAISELSLTHMKLFCTERDIKVIMGVPVGGVGLNVRDHLGVRNLCPKNMNYFHTLLHSSSLMCLLFSTDYKWGEHNGIYFQWYSCDINVHAAICSGIRLN